MSVFFKPTEERNLFHKGKRLDHEVGQDYQADDKLICYGSKSRFGEKTILSLFFLYFVFQYYVGEVIGENEDSSEEVEETYYFTFFDFGLDLSFL